MSRRQQAFLGADLARARKGQRTRTGLGKRKLAELARKPRGGYKRTRSKGGRARTRGR